MTRKERFQILSRVTYYKHLPSDGDDVVPTEPVKAVVKWLTCSIALSKTYGILSKKGSRQFFFFLLSNSGTL